ncbi:MAG: molybdopterin molybdotransferase MoeA [Tissierellia bacterium]|nr:molybdopterin molybdotransferase MoeA [Tissierellia bacterium]
MNIDLLKVKSLSEAVEICKQSLDSLDLKKVKSLKIEDSLGYRLAEDILAKEDLPAFRKSTMDGFAVASKSTLGASDSIPTILEFQETIDIGYAPKMKINANQASKIFTGGMLAQGSDSVVPIEYAEFVGDNLVAIYRPASFLENVIDIGDDCKKGDLYFRKGQLIEPKFIGAFASLGYSHVKVYDKLKVRIISTGDEILPPDADIPLAKTRDINSYSISALCKEAGLEILDKRHVFDLREQIMKELMADDVDILIISGSSSKGDKDFVPSIIAENFTPGLLIHGIALKPGKPTSFSSDGKKLVLGLPGHPVSAYTVFKVFFEEGLKDFYGSDKGFSFPASLTRNVASSPGRTKIQFVNLEKKEDGLIAQPVFAASGNISLLKNSDAYFIIDQDEEGKEKGETVWCKLI